METQVVDVQTFIGKQLHSLLFLEEFVFARNKFAPPGSSERELADAIVMFGDVLFIFQIKERSPSDVGDAEAERHWFNAKVLRKATRQIRDTLRYLESYPEIRIPNERGHLFNVAGAAFRKIIKVIVYRPSPNLPPDCRRVRHYVSSSAGFMHIVDARDYLEIGRTLRVPIEVVRYFEYREMVLTRFADSCAGMPEPAIAGHFVGSEASVPPTLASASNLLRLVQDDEEWDLAPLLRGLHDNLSNPRLSTDYYSILVEFQKLPRSMWRMVKQRIRLCIEKVQKDEFAQPYRVADPETNCGFVFIPVPSDIANSPDWPESRMRALQNFTHAHKYDQKLQKCVGVIVALVGGYFDIAWYLVDHEWQEDPEMQRALDDHFPFRPVKQAEVYGYMLSEE